VGVVVLRVLHDVRIGFVAADALQNGVPPRSGDLAALRLITQVVGIAGSALLALLVDRVGVNRC